MLIRIPGSFCCLGGSAWEMEDGDGEGRYSVSAGE